MAGRFTIADSGSDQVWYKGWLPPMIVRDAATREVNARVHVCTMVNGLPDRETFVREDRLVPLPKTKEELRAEELKDYLTADAPRVTRDEALEFLAFSLLQCGGLFERTESGPEAREEFLRVMTMRGESPTGPFVVAAMAYWDAATKWYREDGERDG